MTRIHLGRRRLRVSLASEQRKLQRIGHADRNLDPLVTKIAHDDCALARIVSALDTNPSLALVELDRGEILAAIRQAPVTLSQREQFAMEPEQLLMLRLLDFAPI